MWHSGLLLPSILLHNAKQSSKTQAKRKLTADDDCSEATLREDGG
jgi:hypothetical protein